MRFFAIFLIVIAIGDAVAQKSMITGQVQNIKTGQPVEFAHVFIANTTNVSTTDEKGDFTLQNLDIGEFDLVASFVGYELYVKRIQIVTDSAFHILIEMTPQLMRLDEVEVSVKKDLK